MMANCPRTEGASSGHPAAGAAAGLVSAGFDAEGGGCHRVDDLDLAITYDDNLAPASPDPVLETAPLWSTPWGLGVRADTTTNGIANLSAFADSVWIVNSRNTADEDAVRTLAALAGITPHIAHQIDSLDLVEDLILDGYRVGLLPVNRPTRDGIAILRLMDPSATLTAYAVTRRGRSTWSPQRTILDRLRPQSPSLPQEDWPRPAPHPSAPDVNEP
jgi:DNA-binding transcriptional LysR family regulator